ncbi:hypothetical protein FGIG_02811 [Fasciola gigantica]|uniref:Uncharacterized protein n=1 Tax=Fasciola gigantica TaxID=46835 RepID=A0A504YE46_FASGI|nr:hypothetical protein FGIG_02811 [Fasciola gigantica]
MVKNEVKQNGTNRIKYMRELDCKIACSLTDLSPKHVSLLTWVERRLGARTEDDTEDDHNKGSMNLGDTVDWDEKASTSDGSLRATTAESVIQTKVFCHFPITKRVRTSLCMVNNLCDALEARFQLIDEHSRSSASNKVTVRHERVITRNYQLLLSTDELGADLNSLVQLQRKLLGWESDMEELGHRMSEIGDEVKHLVRELHLQAPSRRDLYLASNELNTVDEVKHLAEQLVDQ